MYSDPSSAEGVFIDALPYYDNDLASQPNLKALVDSEIARELKAFSPPKPGSDRRLQLEQPLFKVRRQPRFSFSVRKASTWSQLLHLRSESARLRPRFFGFGFLPGSGHVLIRTKLTTLGRVLSVCRTTLAYLLNMRE